ncbi:MAG: YoaP domain-containing protein [Bacteroidales bacterium]|nr:YoaP domain-containing protein [Bacteroidales bacterium]
MSKLKIIEANPENLKEFGMCGYKNPKIEGFQRKIKWTQERMKEGMRYNVLYSEEKGAVGAIEYIPGDYAWRPVNAKKYMFIHCLFILPKNLKGKGFGQMLLDSCIEDTKNQNMLGVAVVTRKGTWMASRDLFIKNGFVIADSAKPDFELLFKSFNNNAEPPTFNDNCKKRASKYAKGLFLITSDQCPYTTKAISEISETAVKEYKIKPTIIELKNYTDAQNSPSAFGTFCILYNGLLVAENPISNTRFKNIMNKQLSIDKKNN